MLKHPAVPYVAPFLVFLVFLSIGGKLGLGVWEFPFRVAVLSAVIWFFSRKALDLRMPYFLASVGAGALVFLVWIAPDYLVPGWRQHWLFSNALTGTAENRLPPGYELSPMVLIFRGIRATIIVPIVEELFWRGWLMRWLINPDFEKVPLGAYTPASFLLTALLFASEHGAYWEVGLAAGLIYNAWMIRTKSLGDCILAHAVTNGILSAYVVFANKWEYWL
jgi:CAAX prenyl protease-like protein